jgi:hypothetical protein
MSRNQLYEKAQMLKNPDTLNEGMQVLREYIHFSNLDFARACKKYDQNGTGTMPEKFLRQILLIELKDTPYYFTDENFV